MIYIHTKTENIVINIVIMLLLYFVFFQHLDSFFIRSWDESMFAVNAYEMSKNGNFITPFYKNYPDLWNSKPPLQLWFQVLFIKLIGFNELAIRLPSAIASSGSAILIFLFIKKRSNIIFALIIFLVFISSAGVSTFHTGRTGDADALLSLLMLCTLLMFYKVVFENHQKSVLYFFVFLSFAFLTKSIAAFLFLPAYLFAAIYTKKLQFILSSKWFYVGIIFFLTITFLFFILREQTNKGYINYVLENDIGRISKVVESHKEPFDYYFNNIFFYRFRYILLLLPGIFLFYLNSNNRKLLLLLFCTLFSYLLIISWSITKLEWYDLPLFPLLSFFSSYTIYSLIKLIKQTADFNTKYIYLFIVIIFCVPIYYTCRNSFKSEIPSNEKKYEALSEYAFHNQDNESLNNSIFYTTYFDRPLFFYKYKLNTKNKDFMITDDLQLLKPNDTVIITEDSLFNIVCSKFQFKILDKDNYIHKLLILSNQKNIQ